MRRISTYLRSFAQSVREKPLIFAIFVVTVVMSVVISGTFYRLTKNQIEGFDGLTHYSLSSHDKTFDSSNLFGNLSKTNIKAVKDVTRAEKLNTNDAGDESLFSYDIYTEYFASEIFSKNELAGGERVAVISFEHARIFNTKIGDTIIIGDATFKVIRKTSSPNFRSVFIPASCKVGYDDSYNRYPITVGCTGKINAVSVSYLAGLGLSAYLETPFDVAVFTTILFGIAVLAMAAINVFLCYRFITKKNNRRYTLYRTMGAKNLDVAAMMSLETFFVAFFAFVIGMGIDYGITYGLAPDIMASLGVLDYIALFFINLSAVFLTTLIIIIKKIKSQPQAAKQRWV